MSEVGKHLDELTGEYVSKSELKRRIKNREKNKNHVEKKQVSSSNPKETSTDDLDPNKYREARINTILKKKKQGKTVYPHVFGRTLSIKDFRLKYAGLESGTKLEDKVERVMGRVMSKRESSSMLIFYDIKEGNEKIQILSQANIYEGDFIKNNEEIHRGDIIGVVGIPGTSKRGELSLFPLTIQVLTPCLRMLPQAHYGLRDLETRYRQRHLDLIINGDVYEKFVKRSMIINYIRTYFSDNGFLEVETPMMNHIPGGAAAKPFITHHNDLGMNLYMRIAPELYLKTLIVGGYEKVFEIGRVFRNESIDHTHNPEFTSCEAYATDWDYNTWMDHTEALLKGIVKAITGSSTISYTTSNNEIYQIDFTKDFQRIDMIPYLEEKLGIKFPDPTTFHEEEARSFFEKICNDNGIVCGEPKTSARLLDKLVGEYIEPECINPTFIIHHPMVMSPLAKEHRSRMGISERFELFIARNEYANAYTEQNDPLAQCVTFTQQEEAKKQGDDEAQGIDHGFLDALEHGLPPTGGWGLGIDRLVMLLTNTYSIREILFFPAMKPEEHCLKVISDVVNDISNIKI